MNRETRTRWYNHKCSKCSPFALMHNSSRCSKFWCVIYGPPCIEKNHLEMIAQTLLKAAFKFLITFADQKSRRLNVILNVIFCLQTPDLFAFFMQKCIWLGRIFFYSRTTFFTEGRPSPFSVKLCFAQRFMIGYNIIHYLMDITNTHSYTLYPSCS